MSFTTVMLATARVLRDNLLLRTSDTREKVWLLVKQSIPNAKFTTVDRCCRKIQSPPPYGKGMHRPVIMDRRYDLEQRYREFFGSGGMEC